MGRPDKRSYLIDHWLFNQIGVDRGQNSDQPVKPILFSILRKQAFLKSCNRPVLAAASISTSIYLSRSGRWCSCKRPSACNIWNNSRNYFSLEQSTSWISVCSSAHSGAKRILCFWPSRPAKERHFFPWKNSIKSFNKVLFQGVKRIFPSISYEYYLLILKQNEVFDVINETSSWCWFWLLSSNLMHVSFSIFCIA